MDTRTRLLLGGLKSTLPLLRPSYRGTGGTSDARYCYSVWLRHLTLVQEAMPGGSGVPERVVELGPGDSIGTGIAALLSGAQRYWALDVVDHTSRSENLRIFDELVALFRARAAIPSDGPYAGLHPRLTSYDFPSAVLTEVRLAAALDERRLATLRAALAAPTGAADAPVRYLCPWTDASILASDSADLVFSQVALQEMDDDGGVDDSLPASFRAAARWLRPGGILSHQIDFRLPGGRYWNEHWTFSDRLWRLARGRRRRFHNRASLSRYVGLARANGLRVVRTIPIPAADGAPRDSLAPRWRELPEEDLTTSGVYLLAVKGGGGEAPAGSAR